jgi:hypothetical protein
VEVQCGSVGASVGAEGLELPDLEFKSTGEQEDILIGRGRVSSQDQPGLGTLTSLHAVG